MLEGNCRTRSATRAQETRRGALDAQHSPRVAALKRLPAMALTPTERQRRWRRKKRRLETGAAKRGKRAAREQAMAEHIPSARDELLSAPLFGVIYADPPWRFEPRSRVTGKDRAAQGNRIWLFP